MKNQIAKQLTINEAKKLVPSKDVREAIKKQGENEFWEKLSPKEYGSIFYHIEPDWNKQNEMFKNILAWSDDEKTNDEIKAELEYRKKSWKRLIEPEEGFIYKLEAFYCCNKEYSPYRGEYDNWCMQATDFQTALDYGKTLFKSRFFKFRIEKTRLVKPDEKEKLYDDDFCFYLGEAKYYFDENGNCVTNEIYYEPLWEETEDLRSLRRKSFQSAFVPFPYPFKKGDIVTLIKKEDNSWFDAEEAQKQNQKMWISKAPLGLNLYWEDLRAGIKWRNTSDFSESANDLVNFLWLEKARDL